MIPALKTQLLKKSAPFSAKVFMCDACCCGDPRFGNRAPMESLQEALGQSLLGEACPVAITGCMGPCAVGNNVILATKSKNYFFQKMNQPQDLSALGQFVKNLRLDPQAALPSELKNRLAAKETLPA